MRIKELMQLTRIISVYSVMSAVYLDGSVGAAERAGSPLEFKATAYITRESWTPFALAIIRFDVINHGSQPVRILAVKNSFKFSADGGKQFITLGKLSMSDLHECPSDYEGYCRDDDRATPMYLDIAPNSTTHCSIKLFSQSRPSKADWEAFSLVHSGDLGGSLYVKSPGGRTDRISSGVSAVAANNTLR